jgi:hypothetical protein
MRWPTVSRHLRVLREVGLVEVRADARRRIYTLRAGGLVEMDTWIEQAGKGPQLPRDAFQCLLSLFGARPASGLAATATAAAEPPSALGFLTAANLLSFSGPAVASTAALYVDYSSGSSSCNRVGTSSLTVGWMCMVREIAV